MSYRIQHIDSPPGPADGWASAAWSGTETLKVGEARPESSAHRPETACRLLYDRNGLHGRFWVSDRHVVSRRKKFQDMVCKDSCVEFFVQPGGAGPYFNLEMNCSGVFLLRKVIDPTREGQGELKCFYQLTAADAAEVRVTGTAPGGRETELPGPLEWEAGFFLPFSLFEALAGVEAPKPGDCWRGNFYKCADESSHPHWLSWQPLTELNFHLPACFGVLEFA